MQKIAAGEDFRHALTYAVAESKIRKMLLVCDSSFRYLPVKNIFHDFKRVQFSNFTSNPAYEQVCEGVNLFKDEHCDGIVAIGGGSTIDVAKCIKLFSGMRKDENYLRQKRIDTLIPLIAVPTTAGTGSESTRHAVVYYGGEKQSVSHKSIIPDYAILEPSLLKTLPIYQKKCTMLDALCQGIESWWSVNSDEESIAYSKKAVSLIKNHWERYIFDGDGEAARQIMIAANYSGRAINITATTAAHAMSYKLTSMYNLPHGHAVAVCLPEVWKYMLSDNGKCVDSRGEEYLKSTLKDISSYIDPDRFEEMLEKMIMVNPHSENINKDLAMLVKSVNPIRLKNNPVALDENVIGKMYERILK